MPSLDLKQITDKLNAEFAGETRKIVFWYDDAAEFADDIDTLEIVGAKLHKLEPDTMFQTKYLLERYDTESSYLIYAPFPKPDARSNALEDTFLYSRRFDADRASLLMADLRIDIKHKPVIQKHIKFFDAKDRKQRFCDFETETFADETTIEIAIMSALCKTRTASIDEVLRVVLTDGGLDDNPYLADFKRYNLLPVFWTLCEETFGYNIDSHNPPSSNEDADESGGGLMRLALTFFITYTSRQLQSDVPVAWKEFVSYKSGSIIAFLDNLMNSIVYRPQYDELAAYISSAINLRDTLDSAAPESILDCDAFDMFDEFIIKWIAERLLDEDTGAALNGFSITGICDMRKKKHFGAKFAVNYTLLESAYGIVSAAHYSCPDDFKELLERYIKTDHQIDLYYRRFYTAFDRLEDTSEFDALRERVENIYTNKYLGKLLPAWSAALDVKSLMQSEISQLRFFNRHIQHAKEKTVVIISDALRYEAALDLFDMLDRDPNCDAAINYMAAALPTYTQLGMAALLPHKSLEIQESGKVLVDNQAIDSTEKREAILQSALSNSRCIRANAIPAKRDEFRKIFTGMDVVYVCHDHIDIRGSSSDDEVFNACAEAVKEIYDLIKKLSVSGNVYNFIVTADHGFLYKRDAFTESDKINLSVIKSSFTGRRAVIADEALRADGVSSVPLADIIGGEDARIVSWPAGAAVFKTQGGLNYVHCGASPQEMIIPLIKIKTEKSHVDTQPVKIALVSMVQKITNLITQLDFIQQEPVSDVVTPAEYKLYFISEENEKISTEHTYTADKKDSDPNKRMFRQRFNFKNRKYTSSNKYWLVAVNTKSGIELFRHPVIMDIAFADDFGFDH